MSLGSLLCKIWQFIVGAAKAVVDGVKQVLGPVLDLAFDVLGRLLDGVGDAVGGLFDSAGGKLLLLVGAAVGLWWLAGRDDEENKETVSKSGGVTYG